MDCEIVAKIFVFRIKVGYGNFFSPKTNEC